MYTFIKIDLVIIFSKIELLGLHGQKLFILIGG
ncbi:hypothetical protein HNR74_002753 [Flammeovirga kamogawensis]|nr:hypothetical protein [Flammeovirga kamogawensis]